MFGFPRYCGKKGGSIPSGYLSSADWQSFNTRLGTGAVFSGDVSGTYSSLSVQRIRGVNVSSTAPNSSGQVLRYDGSSNYLPAFLSLADIRSAVSPGNTMFPAVSCTSSQTMTWSSLSDTMICSNIAINASAVGGLGFLADNNSVDLSGSEATGTLAAARFPALTGAITTAVGSTSTSIASGAVGSAQIQDASVTGSDIASGTITDGNIANSTIAVGKISATGTASGTTYLRGDGVWAAPPSGGQDLGSLGCTIGASLRWTGTDWKCSESTFRRVTNFPVAAAQLNGAALGGNEAIFCLLNSTICHRYSANTDSFSAAAGLPTARAGRIASILSDGRALFCGGSYSTTYYSRCDIYSPSTNSWTQVANMPQAKRNAGAVLMANNLVLICGGNLSGGDTARCDTYDAGANTFTQVANFPFASSQFAFNSLNDANVLACGTSGSETRCFIYNYTLNTFVETTGIPGTLTSTGNIYGTLDDGRVLVCTQDCYTYEANQGYVRRLGDVVFDSTWYHTRSVKLTDGRILSCGDSSSSNACRVFLP